MKKFIGPIETLIQYNYLFHLLRKPHMVNAYVVVHLLA